MTVCTGFGVGNGVPWRIAAYALPTLQEAGRLGISPEYYFAKRFSTEVDEALSPEQASKSVEISKQLIQGVTTLTDAPTEISWLTERDPFEDDRFLFMSIMAYQLSMVADEQISRFAESRDGDNSMLYMAAHCLYMWDPLDIDPGKFIVDRSQTPERLLMIGGPAEKIFYKARQILIGKYPTTLRETTQSFTEIGRMPPYYPAEGDLILGDRKRPTLDEVLAIENPDVRRDLLYLLIGLSEEVDFSDLKRISKGKATNEEIEDLDAALIKFVKIVKQLES